MSQTERVLRIQQMLQVKKIIPREEFLGELEVSLATLKRDLEFLRSRFQVNIEWSRERGGYHCEDLRSEDGKRKIPGPMYSTSEIHALLLMQDLLIQLQPGLLEWTSHRSAIDCNCYLAPAILNPIKFGGGFASCTWHPVRSTPNASNR